MACCKVAAIRRWCPHCKRETWFHQQGEHLRQVANTYDRRVFHPGRPRYVCYGDVTQRMISAFGDLPDGPIDRGCRRELQANIPQPQPAVAGAVSGN
jgi:hypothetical protein